MSIKVTMGKVDLKDKPVEPFDVYRNKNGVYYVALGYDSIIHLHMLLGSGNRWCHDTTFGNSESEFEYVGKLSEVVVTP